MNIATAQIRTGAWWNKWIVRRAVVRRTSKPREVSATHRGQSLSVILRGVLIMAVGLLLAGILGWVWASLSDPYVLPVKNMEISSSYKHVQAEEVRAAAAPYLGDNFFTTDVRAVQQAVERLPWIRSVEVRRVWPASIHVIVREQVAVATWGMDALLNDAGEPFQVPAETMPSGLPELDGPDGSSKTVAAAMNDMNTILAPISLHITQMVLDERRAWHLTLDNGMTVLLGRGSDGHDRLLRFVRFYQRALRGQEAAVARVDLRYSNGFAVQWKHAATMQ